MLIPINRDFDQEYSNDIWKGFSAKQLCYLLGAAGVSVLVSTVLYFQVKLMIQICIYAGVFSVIPIVALGFWSFQEMSLAQFIAVYFIQKKTQFLFWIPQEYEGEVR